METLSLHIEGMSCQHCVRAVRNALTAVPGVALDSVNLGTATLSFDPAQASADVITEAVQDAGYSATAVLVND
jgi:copper chaperone CopZ